MSGSKTTSGYMIITGPVWKSFLERKNTFTHLFMEPALGGRSGTDSRLRPVRFLTCRYSCDQANTTRASENASAGVALVNTRLASG